MHLKYVDQVLGRREGANVYAAMNGLVLQDRHVVLVDTHVNENPGAAQLAEITMLAAEEMRRFGMMPCLALLSHSNFGTSNSESAKKMRDTLALLRDMAPDMEVDGEMQSTAVVLLKESMCHKSFRKIRAWICHDAGHSPGHPPNLIS